MEDAGEDDLLGGGNNNFTSNGNDDELSGFESSFPAIDTTNDVSVLCVNNLEEVYAATLVRRRRASDCSKE